MFTVVVALLLLTPALLPRPAAAQRSGYQFVANFDHDEKLQGQLDRLKQLASGKQWDEWVTLYQHLIDDRPDGVVPQGPESFVGLRVHLERLFAQAPPEARQLYRTRYDPTAKQLWDQASAASSAASMRKLYHRYRHSSYARRALLWLANRDLDHGEFEHARLAFARLAADPDLAGTESPWVLLKWALAAARMREQGDVTEALDQLGRLYGSREMRIGGRTMAAADVAQRHRRLLAPAAGTASPAAGGPPSWPAFAGARGDRLMSGQVEGPLKLAWQWGLSTNSSPSGRSARVEGPWGAATVTIRSSGSGPFSQLALPVTYEESLFVQSAASVQCVRVADGKLVWTAKEPFEMNLPSRYSVQGRFSSYSRAPRTLQGAPVAARGRVYVRMPVGNIEGYSGARWPADYALASLDARTGEPIWLRLAGGTPAGTYYNLPTLRGNTLYTGIATPVAGLTEFRATAVDAGTGEHRWSSYLGTGTDPMTSTDGSPPAMRDGIVWVESSLHTLNALDALTGDILWIYRYQPRPTPYFRSGWQDTLTQANEPVSLIAAAGGRVLFSPRWGDQCVALDGRTGRLQWSYPKGEARTLFAVDAQRCYLCGDQVLALDLATGARRWSWEVPDDYTGLAALAENRVYVPVGPDIYALDAANGQKAAQIDLRKHGVDPGYAALTVIGGRLLLSQGDRLMAFEKDGLQVFGIGPWVLGVGP